MATKTINYNLVKPAGKEKVSIDVLNSNMDVIDQALKGLDDRTVTVANNLTTDEEGHALDAVQGKVLANQVTALNTSLNGVVQSLDGLTETSINICASTDYTVNRVRGMTLTTTVPTTVPNGCLVGVYV